MSNTPWPDRFGIDARVPPEGTATTLAVRYNFERISRALGTLDNDIQLLFEDIDRIPIGIDMSEKGRESVFPAMPSGVALPPWVAACSRYVDLTAYNECRIFGVTGSQTPGGLASFRPARARGFSTNVADFIPLLPAALQVSTATPNTPFDTDWVRLDDADMSPGWIGMLTYDGDDVSPQSFFSITFQFRWNNPEP